MYQSVTLIWKIESKYDSYTSRRKSKSDLLVGFYVDENVPKTPAARLHSIRYNINDFYKLFIKLGKLEREQKTSFYS